VPEVRIIHIGGPTTLIEIDSLRLLTDPTFDAPGRRYTFGWGRRVPVDHAWQNPNSIPAAQRPVVTG
jgi:hypothetical protein